MTTVTVVGALGHTVVVNFAIAEYAALANSLLPHNAQGNLLVDHAVGKERSYVTTQDKIGLGENQYLARGTDGSAGTGGIVNIIDTSSDAGEVIVTGTGTNLDFTSDTGSGTIIAGGGLDTFNLGSGSWDLMTGLQGTSITLGSGNDTVTMGGPDTLVAGSGNDIVYGEAAGSKIIAGSGSLHYIAGTDSSTTIVGGTGTTYATGNDGASVVFVGDSSGNIFSAGAGNETLDASGATGNNSFYAVGGSDSMTGGSGNDNFFTSGGASTLTGGGGVDTFTFASDGTAGHDVVTDFSSSDYLQLLPNLTISSETATGGNLDVTLSDGTTVQFIGVTSIDPSHVI